MSQQVGTVVGRVEPRVRGYREGRSSVGCSPFCLARDNPRRTRELGRVPADQDPAKAGPPLIGEELLERVNNAMVALHQRYHHREPITARTQMLGGDLLACVLGGVYTDVEKTMIELQKQTIVRETRSDFQNAMQQTFIDAVEDLSGRAVLTFMSTSHVGPDLEVKLFVLEGLPPGPDLAFTA
jgi:uncharacterized protein YbcI